MHIKDVTSSLRFDPYNMPVKFGGGSFADMLNAAQQGANSQTVAHVQMEVSFPYGDKQILRAEGVDDQGRRQSIRVEYAANSTPEDPIVMIYGDSYYGDYRLVRRLRDIDLTNATYPEMYALLAHEKALERTNGASGSQQTVGASDPSKLTLETLAGGVPAGDFMEPRNLLDEYGREHGLLKFSLDVRLSADETQTINYRLDTGKEDAEAAAEFERLMWMVDRFIEEIRAEAEAEAEKAEKRALNQKVIDRQEAHDQALKRSDYEHWLNDELTKKSWGQA